MKLTDFWFSDFEMEILRDSLAEELCRIRTHKGRKSDLLKSRIATIEALLYGFKEDRSLSGQKLLNRP